MTWYDGGWTIGPPYYVTEVGAHENSESPYGPFDQGGNIVEIVELPGAPGTRWHRGGVYNADYSADAAYRYGAPATEVHGSAGFRLVQVPEPGSLIMLLAGGGLGLVVLAFRRRRRK